MKRFKIIAYIILAIVIVTLFFIIFTNVSKSDNSDENGKVISEIRYLEARLVYLLNSMNNIESGNYNIKVTELQGTSSQQNSEGDQSSTSDNSSESGKNLQGENTLSSSDKQGESSSGDDEQDKQKYEIVPSGILLNNQDIDWDVIKNEIEIIYTSIPTITMDLYKVNMNQEDILNFNKEYDNLTVIISEKDKEKTLKQLVKLYAYVAKFIENTSENELGKKSIETKAYLLNAYARLDSQEWNEIEKSVSEAIEIYSNLLSSTDIDDSKQYVISKGYVMLNELQNAVSIKDVNVFLIKYKNLIEDFSEL